MKKCYHTSTALIISGLFLFSCQQENHSSGKVFIGEKIANPIIYEVLAHNPNPEDDWKTECLANTDTKTMFTDIIKAVQSGKLKAFDYYDNHQLTNEEVRTIISKNNFTDRIGKIQFEEEWFWDKANMCLHKKVNKIMLAYELYDSTGKIRGYKAGFVVQLNAEHI
ncbi:hypothetical protein [Ancylomarina longa]|uniref:Lipoprotein n=1 Tax=Ancylomarina longa TaxID=2487017 RepID=A0A434AUR5_9BACT|nr:hypothetical protein [Ancylomarina longa]RUT78174.1 hypothetical protein DLK05_10030 [Ancylomarina longa]